MGKHQNWQHTSFLNQLLACVDKKMIGGWYRLEMRLSPRQVDQLEELANLFETLARAEGGPPDPQEQGGD